ncbi:hypothetical protein BKA69DRAFT_654692 [Paraphysoderma sedebokerense]|nr:hypothetical protein BKA69DRAFT_654692 [Paraphysoderma sedebokerense]
MLELCGSSISGGSNGAVQKEQILTRIIKRYFPQLQSRPGYFDVMNRLASDNRQIKVHKEKKLTKFFGERVSIEELQKQIDTALSAPMRPARSDSVHSVSANVVRGRRNRKPSEYNSISEVSSSMSQKEESADLFSKKKKVDKLNEFFGDRVPARQLVEQNLVGVANSTAQTSTTEIADIPPTPTLNELSTDERRLLTKRSKKLRDVLGEPLNEDITYKALTEPIFKSTSPPPIRSDSTAVKAADLSAISPQIASHDEAAGTSIDSSTISFSQQAPSTVSSISVEANLDSKEIRRKKLEKLYRFLGERLSENALESLQNQAAQALLKNPNAVVTASNTPLTPDEKRQTVRRAVKLGKMFGAVPPSQLLSEMDKKTLQHRSSIFSLRQVLHDDNALVDLLALMSDSQADGANPTDVSVAAKADPTSSVISEEMPVPVDKTFRQKKLHKLQRFFGDKVDPVFLFEQNVLATLERTMEEELDSDSLKELKKDLELLRNEVRKAAPKIDASGGSSEKEKEKEKENHSNSSAYSFSSLAKLTDRLTSSYAGGSMKESPKLNRKVVSSSYLNDDGNSAPATITSSLKSLKSESK